MPLSELAARRADGWFGTIASLTVDVTFGGGKLTIANPASNANVTNDGAGVITSVDAKNPGGTAGQSGDFFTWGNSDVPLPSPVASAALWKLTDLRCDFPPIDVSSATGGIQPGTSATIDYTVTQGGTPRS